MTAALLGKLATTFLVLAFLAIGGANATLPEMQRQVVDVQGWMSATEFAALFALANAAPGPNVMIVTLVGWRVAGVAGALVATLAMIGPPALLTYGVIGAWDRLRTAPWRKPVGEGLAAVTAGLVAASAWLLCAAADTSWLLGAITAATAVFAYATKLNPLWMFAAAAWLGALGLT